LRRDVVHQVAYQLTVTHRGKYPVFRGVIR